MRKTYVATASEVPLVWAFDQPSSFSLGRPTELPDEVENRDPPAPAANTGFFRSGDLQGRPVCFSPPVTSAPLRPSAPSAFTVAQVE